MAGLRAWRILQIKKHCHPRPSERGFALRQVVPRTEREARGRGPRGPGFAVFEVKRITDYSAPRRMSPIPGFPSPRTRALVVATIRASDLSRAARPGMTC